MNLLPQDLQAMTADQVCAFVDALAAKPLEELRRNQDIIHAQQQLAPNNSNLAALDTLYMYAIIQQVFGEKCDCEYVRQLIKGR